jgi:hypothetical protein
MGVPGPGDPVFGFQESRVQPLLAFDVGFLALLFLVQAWQASRSSGEHEQEDDTAGRPET